MSDDTKAAPSLADEFEAITTTTAANHVIKTAASKHEIGAWAAWNQKEILAALRAVEAVRAFSVVRAPGKDEDRDYDKRIFDDGFRAGYRHGVEAVQALLEGDP